MSGSFGRKKERAPRARVAGSVSLRHDPLDAIEETLKNGDFHEIVLSTLPRSISRWLHVDLPHRVAHLGLPVTTVIAAGRSMPQDDGTPGRRSAASIIIPFWQ